MHKMIWIVVFILLICSPSWAVYDLPADRKTVWSQAGISGGIPSIPTQKNAVTDYGAHANGVDDDTTLIQNCLDGTSAGYACYLPPGTYRISTTLTIPNQVVLRGAGPTQTIINIYGGDNAINTGGLSVSYSARSTILSGATKGSNSIVLASGEGTKYSVGDQIIVEQAQSAEVINCGSWCGYWSNDENKNSRRVEAQVLNVASKTGDTIVLSGVLHRTYTSPFLTKNTNFVKNVGIEDLYIEMKTSNSDAVTILLTGCSNCWIKNVKSYMTGGKHIRLRTSNNCEITGNWVNDGFNHGGDASYGINLVDMSCDNYVYNNIAQKCRHSYIFECGGMGNVIAYNYSVEPYNDAGDWLTSDLLTHGGHPQLNLFEGNIGSRITTDNELGSSNRNTYFRTQAQARSSYPGVTQPLLAFDIQENNYNENLIGCVWGAPGYTTYLKDGRYGCASDGCPTGEGHDPQSQTTSILHACYSFKNNMVTWHGTDDHTLPTSMYLSSKPSWYGGCTWPPIGPDVSGYVKDIPAKLRYEGSTCPPPAGTPSAPKNLRIIN